MDNMSENKMETTMGMENDDENWRYVKYFSYYIARSFLRILNLRPGIRAAILGFTKLLEGK